VRATAEQRPGPPRIIVRSPPSQIQFTSRSDRDGDSLERRMQEDRLTRLPAEDLPDE
jgi:hypothetical protein